MRRIEVGQGTRNRMSPSWSVSERSTRSRWSQRAASSLSPLAVELVETAGKARNRKLSPDDMKGGTFTISNGPVLRSPRRRRSGRRAFSQLVRRCPCEPVLGQSEAGGPQGGGLGQLRKSRKVRHIRAMGRLKNSREIALSTVKLRGEIAALQAA